MAENLRKICVSAERNGKRKPRQIQTCPTSFYFIYINENHYTKVPCLSDSNQALPKGKTFHNMVISLLSIHSRC